jgi:hypothetical protein
MNRFVEVENDAAVDGGGRELLVANFRCVCATWSCRNTAFTLTNGGTATVNKTTREYSTIPGLHYVYWSSPVASADLATVFPNPYLNRRYYFDASLFLDECTVGASRPSWYSRYPRWILMMTVMFGKQLADPMEVGRGYVIATDNSAYPTSDPYE